MTPRMIGTLALILLIGALIVFGPAACNRYLIEKKAGEIAQGQNEATLDSIDVANSTAARLDELEAQTETDVKESVHEIQSAPAGDSNAAAVRASCRLRAYRDSERCARVRAADPARPAG